MEQNILKILFVLIIALTPALCPSQVSQDNSDFRQVNTYGNPVLPGDHPDPILLKVGDDFYHCNLCLNSLLLNLK